MKNTSKAVIGAGGVAAALALLFSGSAPVFQGIRSSGVLAYGCLIYWDSEFVSEVDNIYWGILKPGSEAVRMVYLVPDIDSHYSLETGNYTPPEAEQFLSVSWNCSTGWLLKDRVYPVVLTLKVSPQVRNVTDFSFTIAVFGVDV